MELTGTCRAGNIYRQSAGLGGSGCRAGLGGGIAQVTEERTRGSAAGQQQDRRAGPEAGRLQEAGRGPGSARVAGVPPERSHPRGEDCDSGPQCARTGVGLTIRNDAWIRRSAFGRFRRVTGRAGGRQDVGQAEGSGRMVWRGPGV